EHFPRAEDRHHVERVAEGLQAVTGAFDLRQLGQAAAQHVEHHETRGRPVHECSCCHRHNSFWRGLEPPFRGGLDRTTQLEEAKSTAGHGTPLSYWARGGRPTPSVPPPVRPAPRSRGPCRPPRR